MNVLVTGGSGFIGTHLITDLIEYKYNILNIDIAKPNLRNHEIYWKKLNILSKKELLEIIIDFKPNVLIHLAANGGVSGKSLENDYKENTIGTLNVLEAIKSSSSIERVIITSSQVVCKIGHIPKNDTDFSPIIPYDHSKVLTEQYTRKANLNCTWTIIRPTYIWGPHHPRNAHDLFLSIKKGWYLYPGKRPIQRSYGYVKNVTWQILGIINMDKKIVNKQVFYVGDMPINYYDWVNAFSLQLTKKKIRTIPKFILKLMALVGDFLSLFSKKPFLINSYRYRNMTEENITPMEKTFNALGLPLITIQQGISETVEWLNNVYSAKT